MIKTWTDEGKNMNWKSGFFTMAINYDEAGGLQVTWAGMRILTLILFGIS